MLVGRFIEVRKRAKPSDRSVKRLFLSSVAALFLATGAHATEAPACNATGVLNTLARITQVVDVKDIKVVRDLRSTQVDKRWCSAAIWLMGGWQVTYTVEFIDASEGRYWVEVRSRHQCEFVRDSSERALAEDTGRAICPDGRDGLLELGQRRLQEMRNR